MDPRRTRRTVQDEPLLDVWGTSLCPALVLEHRRALSTFLHILIDDDNNDDDDNDVQAIRIPFRTGSTGQCRAHHVQHCAAPHHARGRDVGVYLLDRSLRRVSMVPSKEEGEVEVSSASRALDNTYPNASMATFISQLPRRSVPPPHPFFCSHAASRTTPGRIRALQELRTISDVIVASVVTTAIELVISWNHIGGVNNLDTAAQLIPLAISTAYLLRSLYLWVAGPPSESDPYTTGANTGASSRRGRSQSRREHRGSYFRSGRRDWSRRHRRQSHRSSRQYDGYSYNPPPMTAVPSTPHATYTQQFGPTAEADMPTYR